jgi:hypothetical protein
MENKINRKLVDLKFSVAPLSLCIRGDTPGPTELAAVTNKEVKLHTEAIDHISIIDVSSLGNTFRSYINNKNHPDPNCK